MPAYLLALAVFILFRVANAGPFPAIYAFGDSTVDPGNNDYVATVVRANFPPYGRDFDSRKPTGRFSNGRLAGDYFAASLGLPFPPAYLSPAGKTSTKGVNFATSASGVHPQTAAFLNVPNMEKQLLWFREHKQQLIRLVGKSRADSILSEAIFILSSGSNDYINNYYLNPVLQVKYSKAAFQKLLIDYTSSYIKEMYLLGARKITLVGLATLGCLPSQVTLYGQGQLKCAEFVNADARSFNQALQSSMPSMKASSPGLRLAYVDIYTLFSSVVKNPSAYGFQQALTACCGRGRVAVSFLCNNLTPGTCTDASKYVFWDSFHPSDAMNKLIAKAVYKQAVPVLR